MITLDGNNANGTTGDLLVLNSAYQWADGITLNNAGGNGISVGKNTAALQPQVSNFTIAAAAIYGIEVLSGSNTDGQWINGAICKVEKAGCYARAQLCTQIHVWGPGCQSNSDRDGFYVDSASNRFENCESETNQGQGYNITGAGATGNSVVGGSAWGNGGNGIQVSGNANNGTIAGASIYNNGTHNAARSSGVAFAGIQISATNWTTTSCDCYDNTNAIPAGSYSFSASNPYTGRSVGRTQTNHFAETNPGDYNLLIGNMVRQEAILNWYSDNHIRLAHASCIQPAWVDEHRFSRTRRTRFGIYF